MSNSKIALFAFIFWMGLGSLPAWAQRGDVPQGPSLTIDVRQLPTFNPLFGPNVTEGDAGDSIFYRIVIENTGDATAFDINLTDALPLDYIDIVTCCITTGPSAGAGVTSNPDPGPFGFYWSEIDAGTTVSVSLEARVKNATAPRESWDNTATLTWASQAGGSTAGFEASDTSVMFTVPDVSLIKQVEHPSQTPVAMTFFGGAYSDSTSDPNTDISEHDASNVDLAIGEEFSYIVTVTIPEGTTYSLTMIDLAAPLNNTGGRQTRVMELLAAEVIWVGSNLVPESAIPGLGGTFVIVDSNGDGDGSRTQLFNGGNRDVVNTPDGIENDDDRYVIRITARLDDEDAGQYNGGLSDFLVDVDNEDGDLVQNKIQLQWQDQFGNTTTQNPPPGGFADADVVEPDVSVAKVTTTTNPVRIGDVVRFALTVSNTGTGPAYDLIIEDRYPDLAGNPVVAFGALDASSSTCDESNGFAVSQQSSLVTEFAFDQLSSGGSCSIVFDTVVQNIALSETYSNTGSIEAYDSKELGADDNRAYVGGTSSSTFYVDLDSPTVAEATPVDSPTNNTLPSVVLSISEPGTLAIGGSCGSSDEGAIAGGTQAVTLTQSDNASALAEGTYSDCTATVTDAAGNVSEPLSLSPFTIDTTPPALISFKRSVPVNESTNADMLTFRATFDGDVQNVDATDFAAAGTTAIISAVAPVTGTSVLDVIVSGGDLASLDGVVGLNLAASQDIVDAVGNPLAGTEPAIDETYAIDNTEVTVTVETLITTDSSPALSGEVDDDLAELELLVDGQTHVPTNNGDGSWSLPEGSLASLAAGTYDVVLNATDPAGNVSNDSTTDELTIRPEIFQDRFEAQQP